MGLGPSRAWSRVVVDGTGRLTRDLADDLRTAGVGQVRAGLFALDAELRLGHHSPDLVVLVGPGSLRSGTTAPLMARGIPHLPVTLDELDGVVGPLVLPGRSPCLTCVSLARRPDPVTRAASGDHTAYPPVVVGLPTAARADPGLHALTRATAVMTVCAALDDQCPPGVSLELALPWPRTVQRVWRRHPACDCRAPDTSGRVAGRQWSA